MKPSSTQPNFFSKKGVFFFLSVAAIGIFAAFYFDTTFRSWIVSTQSSNWKHSGWHMVFVKLSAWGDWPQLIGLGIVASLIARILGSRQWAKIFVTAIISAALAGMLATACRSVTGRTRPAANSSIPQGWYGPYRDGHCLIGAHDYNSFPSGHTATAVGLAAVILFSRPLWGIPCMLIAFSIVASRLYLGQHHLSDVVVSFFLGMGIAWCCWKIAKQKIT